MKEYWSSERTGGVSLERGGVDNVTSGLAGLPLRLSPLPLLFDPLLDLPCRVASRAVPRTQDEGAVPRVTRITTLATSTLVTQSARQAKILKID
ncbi:hypothetical protein Bpfe_025892 [Biomphalaria pfeifferi]|uniref:Uncharacterized protein n=1 Tax=Biomphalaria pfeifferi TaxID=112525 RepID=A0AAD8EZQ8_BIOPF|nr:hypothetical protein Bpfe_025892 [Biomphalaria pfeifferi]